MGGRDTDTVIKGLEGEIERLSAKLRKSYDTHAETVTKFEHDIELFKRELNSAYQLSAHLTGEKAQLASAANDTPDYARQVEEQLRVLTTELKKANEERRNAGERIAELQASLEAAESVATNYFSSLNQVEREYTSAKEDILRLSIQLDGVSTTQNGTVASASRNKVAGDHLSVIVDRGVDEGDLQKRVIDAEQLAKEYESRIRRRDEQYAASETQVACLTKELANVKKNINQSISIQKNTARENSPQTSHTEELSELRSRIEAAEYILADYQAKLKQAEIDRDEALRDLKRVTAELDGRRYSGDAGIGRPERDASESKVSVLEQKLAQATRQQTDQQSEEKRIRSRLKSAETLASNYMLQAKNAGAEQANLLREIERLKGLLLASNAVQSSLETITDEEYETRLNDLEAARVRAEQETRKVQQQLAIANDLYETLKKDSEALETTRAANMSEHELDSERLAALENRVSALQLEREEYERQLTSDRTALDHAKKARDTAEARAEDSSTKSAVLEQDYQSARGQILKLSGELEAEQARLHDITKDCEIYAIRHKELSDLLREHEQRLAEATEKTSAAELSARQADAERQTAEKEIEVLQIRIAELEHYASSAENNSTLVAELDLAKQNLDAQRKVARDAETRIAALAEAAKIAENKIEEYRVQRDSARGTSEMLSAKVVEAEERNRIAMADSGVMKDQWSQLDKSQRGTQEKLGDLVQQLAEKDKQVEKTIRDQATLEKERGRLAKKLKQYEEQLTSGKHDAAEKMKMIEASRRDQQETRERATRLEMEIVTLKQDSTRVHGNVAVSEQRSVLLEQANEKLAGELKTFRDERDKLLANISIEREKVRQQLSLEQNLNNQLKMDNQLLGGKISSLMEQVARGRAQRDVGGESSRPRHFRLRLVERPMAPGTSSVTKGWRRVSGSDWGGIDVTGAPADKEEPAISTGVRQEMVKTIPVQGIDDLIMALTSIVAKTTSSVRRDLRMVSRFILQVFR
ncbi:MAG: hypothetical protein FD165_291 [Gammaproteobacteria bacterium]|nr:MAG: hypothetical protein FD165_291 [Gammaproteobacteria bacterium]TND06870.1 MAG: hypothetical protein FD120_602 [Gammaproteobacteria bacterium]